MKQTIGILLDHETFMGVPRKRTGHEHIHLYNQAAKQLELRPLYMSLQNSSKGYAWSYSYRENRYRKVKQRLPKVIHNRAMTLSPAGKQSLKRLAESSTIFNRENRYGKYRIYRLLHQKQSMRAHLPYTLLYSRANLLKAMSQFGELYIKPSSGSVGDGIIKIKYDAKGLWTVYWKRGKPARKTAQQTVSFINRLIGQKVYIIQEAIALATYQGRPYDLRVSVQRNKTGEWQVTGMVGKVAAAGRHVTNVAKGGKVRRCEELFKNSGFEVKATANKIQQISLEIAAYLGNKLSHLADIGLDMAVDRSGRIKFIEMNGRDQRIAFKKAGMPATFFKTYLTPLQYAKFIMRKKLNMHKRPKP